MEKNFNKTKPRESENFFQSLGSLFCTFHSTSFVRKMKQNMIHEIDLATVYY